MAISAKFEADFSQFVAESQKATASLSAIEQTSQSVASSLGALGSSWVVRVAEGQLLRDAIREVIDGLKAMAAFIPEVAMKGAAFGDIEEAFKRLTAQAGLLSDALLTTLRTATHGTIDDFDLMKRVNENLAAGVNLTTGQFGTLAQGAFALAKATGTDVKAAFDVMNDAMLTGRTRSLAMLTGKIDLTDAEEKYALSLDTTRDHLTAEGKMEAARQAILLAVGGSLERLGEQTDSLDEKVKQGQVSWANFELELGKQIAQSPVVAAGFDTLKTSLAAAFGGDQKHLIEEIGHAVDQAAIVVVDFGLAAVQGVNVAVTAFELLKGAVVTTTAELLGLKMIESGSIVDGMKVMAAGVEEGARIIKDATLGQSEFQQTLTKVGGALFQTRDAMIAAAAATTTVTATTTTATIATTAHNGALQMTAKDADNAAKALLQLAELEAAAEQAAVTQTKATLALQESAQQQHDALLLAEDQNRVKLGLMTETAYQADKTRIEFDAFQRHLDNLKTTEAADLASNGIKLDAELAKVDERYARGLVTKEEYEAQYAAIELRYAIQRQGIQDAYQVHVDAALDQMQAVHQKAQDAMVADWTATKLAAAQYQLGITMGQAAIEGDLNSQIKNVHTLAGEWIAAADAKKLFDLGSSVTYNISNRQGIEAYRRANTGMNIAWSDEEIMAYAAKGGTLQDLIGSGVITMKPYALGGPVLQDGPIYAHAGEYVIPKGGGSGAGTVNNFYLVDNSENLARKVSDLITRQMLRGGARLGTV
jgi:hypothetical protein